MCSSTISAGAANAAVRSRSEVASERSLEISLPALFLRVSLLFDCRPEPADIEVALVPIESEVESRELAVVVGVLVYVVDDAEPRFGVELMRLLFLTAAVAADVEDFSPAD